MVSDSKEHWRCGEGEDLILDEIVPGDGEVLADGKRFGDVRGLVLHVFIEIVDGAKIAEVPVEGGAALFYTRGNSGHDHVAAIARIAGNGEVPGGAGGGGLR